MFKKLIFSLVIVISFMVTLVGMEPDICPKFNTLDEVNSFLSQLKKTGRTKDHTFQYQGNTWVMSDKEFLMLKESIFHKNEESISKETTEDYFIVDEIQFVRKKQLSLLSNTKDILCYYDALGTGRKNSKLDTFKNPFYLRNVSYEHTKDEKEYGPVTMFTHDDIKGTTTKNTTNPIKKNTTTQGARFQGNWEETFKLNNGATVLHTPKDIVWKPVPFMTSTNPSPGTSMNVNGKQIIFPNLQPYMSREEFVAVLKATGYYDGS